MRRASLVFFVFAATASAQYLRSTNVPVLQVYPPAQIGNVTDDRISLYLALMQSFGGGYTSAGVIPGIQVALDEINTNVSVLPGYRLHYYLTDTQCNHVQAQDQFIKQISEPPTKIAAIGGGCSLATEPTAEISHYWQIPQISCTSSSPNLGDRNRFKRHFALIQSEESLAYGYYGIIKRFHWRRVTILLLDVDLFEVSTYKLAELLVEDGIEYTINSFTLREGISRLGDNPFEDGNRIFILEMYDTYAAELLCKAYSAGVRYPQYVLIHPAWYAQSWWNGSNDTLECSSKQRESVLPHTLSVYQYEFIEDYEQTDDNGMTGSEFLYSYYDHFNSDPLFEGLMYNALSQTCYDGTWALALALHQTLQDISNDSDLNARAQRESMLNTSFRIEDFTYNNTSILEVLFGYLEETHFRGITGDIRFDSSGIRIGGRLQVFQSRYNQQGMLQPVKVADVMRRNNSFLYISDENDGTLWPDGVPYDGVPEEEIVTVHVAVTVVFVLLTTAGLIFTIVCLIFNFIFRKKRMIRLSSPNLNYLIGTGAILLYVDAFLLVTPSSSQTVATTICNITPWLTSLGYSLCFGTIMAKTVRVFYIFNNPTIKKKKIKDHHLFVFIAILVIVDLVILVIYTVAQGVKGDLTATKHENAEDSSDITGVLNVEYDYFIYVCVSTERQITLGILYGYKALLQFLSVILALKTRNVTVKGLDDAKYIIAATYLSSLVLLAVIIMTYTAFELINTYAVVTSASFILGSTIIVALVFIPKMILLSQDPDGSSVFQTNDKHAVTTPNIEEELTIATLRQKIEELEKKITQNSNNEKPTSSQAVL